MPRFSDPEPIRSDHVLEGFDSGVESLDRWLLGHGLTSGATGSARAFVTTDAKQHRVVGYHALTAASIEHEDSVERAARGMPRHPIPAVLLARLAVDRSVHGRGLGAWLLRDAMLRALAASDELGIRVMIVHAMDDSARRFYIHHGLEPSPTDRLNLQILIKDIRAAVERA